MILGQVNGQRLCQDGEESDPDKGGMGMPKAAKMRARMLSYLEAVEAGDADAAAGLFADSISMEDPVGGPPGTHVEGIEAVRAFLREGFASTRPRPSRRGPVVTTRGDEAAMAFTLFLEIEGVATEIDVIDVMRFDEDHRVLSLRAFWNFTEARRA